MARTWRPQVAVKFFERHPPIYIEPNMVIMLSNGELLTPPDSLTQRDRKAGGGRAAKRYGGCACHHTVRKCAPAQSSSDELSSSHSVRSKATPEYPQKNCHTSGKARQTATHVAQSKRVSCWFSGSARIAFAVSRKTAGIPERSSRESKTARRVTIR